MSKIFDDLKTDGMPEKLVNKVSHLNTGYGSSCKAPPRWGRPGGSQSAHLEVSSFCNLDVFLPDLTYYHCLRGSHLSGERCWRPPTEPQRRQSAEVCPEQATEECTLRRRSDAPEPCFCRRWRRDDPRFETFNFLIGILSKVINHYNRQSNKSIANLLRNHLCANVDY